MGCFRPSPFSSSVFYKYSIATQQPGFLLFEDIYKCTSGRSHRRYSICRRYGIEYIEDIEDICINIHAVEVTEDIAYRRYGIAYIENIEDIYINIHAVEVTEDMAYVGDME